MMMLMPARRWIPDFYWRVEGLFFHWLLAMVALWSDTAGYQIVEVGDDITKCCGERTLVLANHQSTGDVPLLMTAFNARPGVLPRLMWIMDRLFRYTNFGIVSVLHGDFFIASGKTKRDATARDLRDHMRNYYLPIDRNWIVLFPEGGFLRKRRATSQRFAASKNLPFLKNVSLPRAGALKVIIEEAGPKESNHDGMNNGPKTNNALSQNLSSNKLKWVLDITIGYEKAKPIGLPDIVTGLKPPCVTHLHYRVFPSTDVPIDQEEMTHWLYDRFIEKEKLLEYFYEHGHFPTLCPDGKTRDNRPILIYQDYARFVMIHLFFIMSSIFLWRVFSTIYPCIADTVSLIIT